jgi:MFS family permease
MTDRFGRRLVFYVTLIVYLAGVLLSATSWDFWSFALFRAITGFGIGGGYAAINSAIDELIPANFRGRVDLIVNGSFWLGAAAGSGASLLFLDPNILPINLGWRLGFAVGGVLGLGILLLRWYVAAANHSGVAWVWEISYRGAGLKREILRAQWIAPGSSKPVSEMAPTQRMGGHGVPGRHQPPPGKVLFTKVYMG